MNEIGLFLGGVSGNEAAHGGRSTGRGDDVPRLGLSDDDLIGFQALFASLSEGRFASQAQQILRALGLDEAARGRIDAALGSGDRPVRDLNTINPELRAKLERVRSRMLSEHGHTVNVVETHRSQTRQTELFAQGRSEPGPIVTWTQESAHTEGLAVDVIVDGTYDNPDAYARLQRIASEEGLRTLGPNDRGHLELATPPANDRGESQAASGIAATAAVARVARVATPGNAPPVAEPQIAVPNAPGPIDAPASPFGASAPMTDTPPSELPADGAKPGHIQVDPPDFREPRQVTDSSPKIPTPAPKVGPTTDRPTVQDGVEAEIRNTESGRIELRPETRAGDGRRGDPEPDSHDPSGRGTGDRELSARVIGETPSRPRHETEVPEPEAPDEGLFRIDRRSEAPAQLSGRGAAAAEAVARAEATAATDGQASVERAQQVRDLQLDGRTHRVSRLVLEVPDGADSIGRIDISARGERINARIDASVSNLAHQLRTHITELQQGLAERGLQAESLLIRETQAIDAIRAAASASALSGSSETSGSTSSGRGTTGEQTGRDQTAAQRDANDPRSGRDRTNEQNDGKRREQ